jgi:hypothetical protein
MAKHEMKLEPLCEVEAYVSAPFPVGPSSWGTRLIFPVIGEGTVKGPKLNGKIHPFGADWGIIRADNSFDLDVRIVIETDDGAFIHTYYRGIAAMSKEEVGQFLTGDLVKGLSLYTTPRFETSHEKYQWLTSIQAVGRGGVEQEGDRVKVTHSWYALTA